DPQGHGRVHRLLALAGPHQAEVPGGECDLHEAPGGDRPGPRKVKVEDRDQVTSLSLAGRPNPAALLSHSGGAEPLVSVSGAPPTPRPAGPASSVSAAPSVAISSQTCRPHQGCGGRIRGRRAARRGTRAIPSACLLRRR